MRLGCCWGHAGGVDLVLDSVGMVEGVVVDLAGLVGLVLNSVAMVLNLDGMVRGLVVVLIGMAVD